MALLGPRLARRGRPPRRPRRRPLLERYEVPVPGLPAALDGLVVAHFSDVHVQRLARPRHLDRAVEAVNALDPDLTFLTGDYVCWHRGAIPRLARSLAALRTRTRPFATLGNHDHWCDGPGIRAALERVGIHVLQNEHATVELRGASLSIVGVDDARTRRHDPVRSFAGAPDLPTIALTHDPTAADAIAPFGPMLILAGHTHGGQVKIPKLTAGVLARLGHRYTEGLYALSARTTLFVSRGMGAALPVRVNAPPELAVLVLRRP